MCEKINNIIEIKNFPCRPTKYDIENVCTDIVTVNESISYNDFFERFMLANKPCVFSNFITRGWPCLQNWTLDGKPKFSYLLHKYGESSVPVANCEERYYNAQKKSTYKLSDYLKYWQDHSTQDKASKKNLYLKVRRSLWKNHTLDVEDWHMVRDHPEVQEYIVPEYFASDWLNEYFSIRKDINDDFRFVYMGPEDTWTPLHADVYSSYSWSVNICGRKRWIFFPPGEEECLKDKFGNLVYDVESSELKNNHEQYPRYRNLRFSFEVIQESGEAIFVPAGWHHQVWNLEHTISINHNWLNGCNIVGMWEFLQQSLAAVQKEVEDCRDMIGWDQHCQIMLRATYGLNYEEFFGLLSHIGRARLRMLEEGIELKQSGDWFLGKNHALWDLSRVYIVLKRLLSDPNADWFGKDGSDTPEELASDIKSVIKEHSVLWDTCVESVK